MSERLVKLLAELEYLRIMGQYLIHECDKVLEQIKTEEHTLQYLSPWPNLQN